MLIFCKSIAKMREAPLVSFQQAINQFIAQLTDICNADTGFDPLQSLRLTQVVSLEDFSPIDWFDAQAIYPKFYWQSRDAHEEVLALGAALSYHDPLNVYADLSEDQRVWGGKPFDEQASSTAHTYLFLPQIELARVDETWRLHINLNGDINLLIARLKDLVLDYPALEKLTPQKASLVHAPNFEHWAQILDTALAKMAHNEFEKVVPARQTKVHLETSIRAASLLKASREKNLRSYHFMFCFNPDKAFVGSTPERLYRRSLEHVETEALAGTIGRSDDPKEDAKLSNWLLNDEKNIRENQFVVNDIMQRLTPICDQVVVQSHVELVRLRKVQHLRKKVSAVLKQEVFGSQLLEALQPTAAIAGLPRDTALEFLRQYEPFERNWYSGSLGFISHQNAEFCVSIRSAMIESEQVSLYAGAGIVPGSQAQFEWQELDRKISTLLSLFVSETEISE